MPASHTDTPALRDHLAEPLRLGDPDVHGPLAVFPIFGPAPQPTWLTTRASASSCCGNSRVMLPVHPRSAAPLGRS